MIFLKAPHLQHRVEQLSSAVWLGWDGNIAATAQQEKTETARKNSPIDDFLARSKPA